MEVNPSGWEELKIGKSLQQAVSACGFGAPTPIQQRCIPAIQGGAQVIGIAQTGTGKTAAYIIPVLIKLHYHRQPGPRAVVLAPTKELVMQIAEHARALAAFTDLVTVALYGGVGPKTQIEQLQAGCDLVVATPGRFMELYLRGEIPAKPVQTLVIDEADRMMDMNFMPQLRKIFEVLPPRRQNLLFSATFSERVDRMSQEFLDFPMKIEVTPQATPSRQVSQYRIAVPNMRTKISLLEHLLQDPALNRVMIFTRIKDTADQVAKYIDRTGLGPARAIHSNKGQNTRIQAVREFGDGTLRVLVSTDVSARGIDIRNVSHVINFDVPVVYDDYVHRIGRTGRAAETGESITFVTPADDYHMTAIQEHIRTTIPVLPLPPAVAVSETPPEEAKTMARAIDAQRRRDDPDFQGAFHDRKGSKRR